MLELRFLGPVEIQTEHGITHVGGPKERTVLGLLAVQGGAVSQDRLIDEVWDDPPPASARKILQTYVWRLRTALPDGTLATVTGGYELHLDTEIDLVRFERLVDDAREALGRGDAATARSAFVSALALWRGDPFTACSPARALQACAVRLDELRARAVEGRVEADLALGGHAEVVGDLEEQIRRTPFRERVWEMLVLALYRCGRQADALAAYQRARRVLVDNLGIEPGPALRDLERAILEQRSDLIPAGRDTDGPDARPVQRSIGALPIPTTALVGRVEERHYMAALFADHRLVTLTGVGGTGKTRLAVSLGQDRRPDEDVVFCDLTVASGSGDVLDVVARATAIDVQRLSLAARLGRDPLDDLVEQLRTTSMLMILDNCEHVLDAAAELADRVLHSCGGVRLLATSREPLGIVGEQTFALEPLRVPAGDDDVGAEAVTLFVRRAAEARSGFKVDQGNRAAVVEICRRLDGLPLALELAAARMSHLSAANLASHLDDRFTLLATTRGRRPGRHRTLEATIDWSYELLTAEERMLFARLAVFSGWFRLHAIRSCCATGVDDGDIIDLIGGLVDKSLVIADHQQSTTRYRLLETVRAYAEDKLDTGDPDDTTRAAHCDWILRELEQFPWDERLQSIRFANLMHPEHEDLRLAVRWALARQRPNLVARLVASMAGLLAIDTDQEESQQWITAAVEFERTLPPSERLATAASSSTLLHQWAGDPVILETHHARLVATVEHLQAGHPVTSLAYSSLASLCARRAAWRPAMQGYAELGQRHAPADSPRLQTMADCQRARALMFRGDYTAAIRVLDASVHTQDDDGHYSATLDLALAHHLAGDHPRTLELCERVLAYDVHEHNVIRCCNIYAALAVRAAGDADRSRDRLRTALSTLTALPHPSGLNDCLMTVGAFAALDGRLALATTILAGLGPTSMSVNALVVLLEHYQERVECAVPADQWQRAATPRTEPEVRSLIDAELLGLAASHPVDLGRAPLPSSAPTGQRC